MAKTSVWGFQLIEYEQILALHRGCGHTHTHTHTHTHVLPPARCVCLSLPPSPSLSLTHTHTHRHTRMLAYARLQFGDVRHDTAVSLDPTIASFNAYRLPYTPIASLCVLICACVCVCTYIAIHACMYHTYVAIYIHIGYMYVCIYVYILSSLSFFPSFLSCHYLYYLQALQAM
jgi:hypothetical protein